jgi:flagellar motor switch protein FliN/FliY
MNAVRENNVAYKSLVEPSTATGVVASPTVLASVADLPELESEATGKANGSLDHLLDVSVCVSVELGRTTMTIADLLKLEIGSVVGLDRAVSEPVDLLVQGVLFARGEVVVIDDSFAIRIREILDPKLAGKR